MTPIGTHHMNSLNEYGLKPNKYMDSMLLIK